MQLTSSKLERCHKLTVTLADNSEFPIIERLGKLNELSRKCIVNEHRLLETIGPGTCDFLPSLDTEWGSGL